MKRLTSVVALLVLLASASTAFAAEWTGQIINKNGKLWFSSGGMLYSITNPDKAQGLAGQTVKLMGTADKATKSVTIQQASKAQ